MLLFLDIDGVLVPAKGWKIPDCMPDGFPVFSTKAIAALQRLITEDVTVLLTSSHKSKFSIEEWKHIFRNRGINIEKLQSLPENANNLSRREEIVDWFNRNKVAEDFIIIDDDKSLNDLPGFLKENLIQTSSYVGLTEEHVEAVNNLLQKRLRTAS